MALILDDPLDDGTNGQSFTGRSPFTTIYGTAPTWTSASYHGATALLFPAGVQSIVAAPGLTSGSSMYVSVLCKISAAVTATCTIGQLRSTTTQTVAVQLASTNVIRLVDGSGGSAGSGSVQLPVGSWFRMDWSLNGTTATVALFVDPTSTTPDDSISSSSFTAATMNELRMGLITSTGIGSGTLTLDHPQIDNSSSPGPRVYNSSSSGTTGNWWLWEGGVKKPLTFRGIVQNGVVVQKTITDAYVYPYSGTIDPTPGPAALPTGTGYYTVAQARAGVGAGVSATRSDLSDLTAIGNWVATQPADTNGQRWICVPAGTWTIPYDFNGTTSGVTNAAVFLKPGICLVGQDAPLNDGSYRNKSYTIIKGLASGYTAGSTISGTNGWYLIRQVGSSASTVVTPTTWKRITLDATEQVSGQYFNITLHHYLTSPKYDTVTWLGGAGYANVPPGETFMHSIWDINGTATFTDCWFDGKNTSGSNLGFQGKLNANVMYTLTRFCSENAGHSHGIASYQAGPVTVAHARLINNGAASPSGSLGDGYNSEEAVGGFTLDDCYLDGNSLCDVRIECGDNAGGVAVDRNDHQIKNSTLSNSTVGIRTEHLQTTVPTLTNVTNTCTTPQKYFA